MDNKFHLDPTEGKWTAPLPFRQNRKELLQTDTIRFKISSKDKPSIRRGVLSVVNRLYDPLGFIAPVVIQGKIILRKVVSNTSSLNEALPEHLLKEWEKWKSNLPDLENLRIPHVIVPKLCEALRRELVVYCNASELAIAAVVN